MFEMLRISRYLGGQARDEVEMLFYILKPSKYRHIPRFLKHKYGKSAVEIATLSVHIGNLGHYEDFEKIAVQIEKKSPIPPELERVLYKKMLQMNDISLPPSFIPKDLEEMRKAHTSLLRLQKLFSWPLPVVGDVIERIFSIFFFHILLRSSSHSYKDLEAFVQQLGDQEKKIFLGVLEEYVHSDDIEEDLALAGLLPEDKDVDIMGVVKQTPLWKILKQLKGQESAK